MFPCASTAGPHGVLQSVADAFKMMGKEDFRPSLADPVLFTLAPVMVMIGAVAVQLVLPYTDGLTAAGLNVGIIFIVAITGFTTMAILLGGWSSRNTYSLVGALRSAAQMISYEIPMILGLLIVAMIVGSLNINDVVAAQAHYQWIAFYAPFTFMLFYIASIAELNRGPFDLPESESELVSGYGTEYSGMRFGMFVLGDRLSRRKSDQQKDFFLTRFFRKATVDFQRLFSLPLAYELLHFGNGL